MALSRRYRQAALFIALVFFPLYSGGEVKDKPVHHLSLQNFIRNACSHDKKFQLILIDELTLKYQKALQLPSRDLVLSATGQYNLKLAGEGGDGPGATVALSKLFPMAGTSTSMEYSISPARTGSGFSSTFSALVSQPLARNAFGRNTRMHKKIIGLENRISRYQIIEAYEDYLATLIGLYYQWYSDDALYRAGRRAWIEDTRLLANIRLRYRSRIAYRIDVDRIALQTMASREEMETRALQYRASRDLVYQAVGYRGTEELRPLFREMPLTLTDKFSHNYKRDAVQSRTMTLLQLLIDKGRIEVARAADELLPSTNLMAGYSYNRTILGGRSYAQHLIYGGLEFSLPITREKEKAAVRVQRIAQRKKVINRGDTLERLKNNLNILHRKIQHEKKMTESTRQRVALAQRVTAEETRRYHRAQTSLKDLIDARNILEASRLNLVTRRAAMATLQLEWLRLTDKLVEMKNIQKTRNRLK